MFAALVRNSNGLWNAYTQFGTSTQYRHDAMRYPTREQAQAAIREGRRSCGHRGFRVFEWTEAEALLLKHPKL